MKSSFVGVAFLLMCWSSSYSQANESAGYDAIFPARSRVKPAIDGVLDDETWQNPIKKEYVSYYPVYGETFGFDTVAWLAYDDKNLYFAFSCCDPAPEKIKASMTRRDDIFNDDWIGIALDTLGTGQSAYCFYVNPRGIQGDSLRSSASSLEDFSPDFVWKSAGKLTEKGYQVEISIPLGSLLFKSGKTARMKILFWRRIDRTGTFGSWPERKPGQQVFNNQAPVIYKDLEKSLKLELLPSITQSRNRERINSAEWGEGDNFTDIGLGLKYGLTSSLTVDLAVNPDFSQVESDSYQVEVNRRYPLFYNEKRPFFMEGSDIFNFFTVPNGFFPNAVDTRQIVDPFWGAKLTGSVGRTSFGILAAGDEYPGRAWDVGINPQEGKNALFRIVRGKYSVGRDNYIGMIYTGREFAGEDNRVIGADISYWLFKKQKINLSFVHRISDGESLSSTARGFGRNSDINLLYSFNARSLSIQAGLEHIGEDFQIHTAYLKRTGVTNGWGEIVYNFFPSFSKLPGLKMISPRILFQFLHDLQTGMNDAYLTLGLHCRLLREGTCNADFLSFKESWKGETFDLNQISLNAAIQPTRWLELSGVLNYGDKIYYEGQPPYKGKGSDGKLVLTFQFKKNLNQQFDFSRSDLSRSGKGIYHVNLVYSRTTYQVNKYFFLRTILQYNSFEERLLTDFLASFTFIPGTVIHLGYGGLYEKRGWQDQNGSSRHEDFLNLKRSLFIKAGYLWRF